MRDKVMRFEDTLFSLVRTLGAMSLSQFMTLTVEHYYNKKDPLGKRGDFITAPEISQLFGEMIGIWCAYNWSRMANNSDIMLVEIGGGRGTMMADILRATKNAEGFHDAISIHMVEKSQTLTKSQKLTLEGKHPRISWHHSFSELPKKPTIVVMNELFDALPIHQFVKTEHGWREHMVACHPVAPNSLIFALSQGPTPACTFISPDVIDAPVGSVYESSPTSITLMQQIANHLREHGGSALAIDYGYKEPPLKGTLQALGNHQKQHVLHFPGHVDITAHVDFKALSQTAKSAGVKTYPIINQETFLTNLGIELRLNSLLAKANDKQQQKLRSEYDRLTKKEEMGDLFKVLAIAAEGQPPLAGF